MLADLQRGVLNLNCSIGVTNNENLVIFKFWKFDFKDKFRQ